MAVPTIERPAAPRAEPRRRRPARDRLALPMPGDPVAGWLAPLGVTLFAFLLRWHRLAVPGREAFDEVYYNCDAYMLLRFGAEQVHGDNCVVEGGAAYVVHPPLGKWMIALGEKVFGYDSFGWRISAAVFGALSVLILCRLGRRLFRSTLLGCVAGGLLALDGLHFVQSRVAMLDIFLMFWILAAFACLVVDRDVGRYRLAARMGGLRGRAAPAWLRAVGALAVALAGVGYLVVAALLVDDYVASTSRRVVMTAVAGLVGLGCLLAAWRLTRPREDDDVRHYPGPYLGVRWWRLLAGVCLGAALGVKWSAVWYVAALFLLAFAWDVGARRTAGVRAPAQAALWRDAGALVLVGAIVVPLVYTATWAGWFAGDRGWRRSCEVVVGEPPPRPELCGALDGFVEYHREVYDFHNTLSSPHPYESGPWGWLLLARPVSYFYSSPEDQTSKEILGIGTPAIWWASIPALGLLVCRWVSRRDWRAAAILVGFAAGYLPWFLYPDRTMFLFYALPAVPFMCLAVAYACGVVLGRDDAPSRRRTAGAVVVATYLTLVVLNFGYLYPILSAKVIPYEDWRGRMWLASWI